MRRGVAVRYAPPHVRYDESQCARGGGAAFVPMSVHDGRIYACLRSGHACSTFSSMTDPVIR